MKDDEFIRDVELNYALLWGIEHFKTRSEATKRQYAHYFIPKKNDDIRASRLTKANEILATAMMQHEGTSQDVLFARTLRQGLSEIFAPFSNSLYRVKLSDLNYPDYFSSYLKSRSQIKILFFGDQGLAFQRGNIDLGAYLASIPDHIFAVNLYHCFDKNNTSIKDVIGVLSKLPYHIRSISLGGIDFSREKLVDLFAQLPWQIRHVDIDLLSESGFIKEEDYLEKLAAIKPVPNDAPAKFKQLFSETAQTQEEILAGARDLLESYTMSVHPVLGGFKRFFSLHWGRHHVKPIADIIRRIDAPIGVTDKISTSQELMHNLMAIPLQNRNNGSVLLRIQYIEARMWAAEPDLKSHEIPLSSQPSCSYGTMLNREHLGEPMQPCVELEENETTRLLEQDVPQPYAQSSIQGYPYEERGQPYRDYNNDLCNTFNKILDDQLELGRCFCAVM